MNKCNELYFKRHCFDIDKHNIKIYKPKEINFLVDKFGDYFQNERKTENIFIEDFIGVTNNSFPSTIKECMDELFKDGKNEYANRSLGLLDIHLDGIVYMLRDSFYKDPIVTVSLKDKYFVSENGKHRFIAMKMAYEILKSRCETKDELEKIKRMFIIPVSNSSYNLTRLYSMYLINKFQPSQIMDKQFLNLEVQYQTNEQNEKTAVAESLSFEEKISYNDTRKYILAAPEANDMLNSVVLFKKIRNENGEISDKFVLSKLNNERLILDDNELIEYVRTVITDSKHKQKILSSDSEFYTAMLMIPSFRNFINSNFGDILFPNNYIEENDVIKKK